MGKEFSAPTGCCFPPTHLGVSGSPSTRSGGRAVDRGYLANGTAQSRASFYGSRRQPVVRRPLVAREVRKVGDCCSMAHRLSRL